MNRRVVESDSSGDEQPTAAAADEAVAAAPAAAKRKSSAASRSRKRAALNGSHDDDGDDGFRFEYDHRDMMGDAEDRARLALLTEKDRELELTARFERYEAEKARWEVAQKLKQQKSREELRQKRAAAGLDLDEAEAGDDDDDEGVKRSTRRPAGGATASRSSALDRIRKKADSRRKGLVAELSSDEDDDDDMGEPDEDFNAPYVSKPKKPAKDKAKDKVKDRDRAKEEEEPEKDSAEDDETPATLQDVESIKLSRHKLALWCHEPFFEKTVVGCFVRVYLGRNLATQEDMYQLARIVEVKDASRDYSLNDTRTKKQLVVKHGAATKPFKMRFVSDQPIAEIEWRRWDASLKKSNPPLPAVTLGEVAAKKKDIENAINYVHTPEDFKALLETKRKLNLGPVNTASRRTELERLITLAKEAGDAARVEELQDELGRVLNKQSSAVQKRMDYYNSVDAVNERNRRLNQSKAAAAAEAPEEFDPFVRRLTRPTLAGGGVKEDAAKKAEEEQKRKEAELKKQNEATKAQTAKSTGKAGGDLSNLHDFDLDIVMDDIVGPAETAAPLLQPAHVAPVLPPRPAFVTPVLNPNRGR